MIDIEISLHSLNKEETDYIRLMYGSKPDVTWLRIHDGIGNERSILLSTEDLKLAVSKL